MTNAITAKTVFFTNTHLPKKVATFLGVRDFLCVAQRACHAFARITLGQWANARRKIMIADYEIFREERLQVLIAKLAQQQLGSVLSLEAESFFARKMSEHFITQMPSLTFLFLGPTPHNDTKLQAFLKTCPQLKVLELMSPHCPEVVNQFLELECVRFRKLPNENYQDGFRIDKSTFTQIVHELSPEDCARLAKHTHLQEVTMYRSFIQPQFSAHMWDAIVQIPHLRKLEIFDNNMRNFGVVVRAQKLESLTLNVRFPALVFPHLGSFPLLTELTLNLDAIDDKADFTLLSQCIALENLTLVFNRSTQSQATKAAQALEKCSHLRFLKFSGFSDQTEEWAEAFFIKLAKNMPQLTHFACRIHSSLSQESIRKAVRPTLKLTFE